MSFDLAALRAKIQEGTPLAALNDTTSQFTEIPVVVPKESWHSSDNDAKKHLPPNTVKIYVNGYSGYAFGINVKGTVFHGVIMTLSAGNHEVYCSSPDLSSLAIGHTYHYYGGGRLCIPGSSIVTSYSNFVEWAASYVHFKRTGEEKGFRYFDK